MGSQYTERDIFDKVAEYARVCLTSMEGKEITPDTPVNYDGYESLNLYHDDMQARGGV